MSLRPSRVPVAPLAGLLGLAVALSVHAQTPAPGAAKAVIKPADNLVTDAAAWNAIAGSVDVTGTGGSMTLSDTGIQPKRFYRVGVELP